jgi:hypothetical protein
MGGDRMTPDTNNYEDIGELCVELEHQNEQLANEVERLREQLESTKLLALKFWKVLEENGFKIELPK